MAHNSVWHGWLYFVLDGIQAQDNDDVRAVRQQIKKVQEIWARVGLVLTADNTTPKVSAKFYKAVVQSVLLYGSETWNLMTTALVQLEGFHIRAAYRMAEKHKPKKGPHHEWVYPWSPTPYRSAVWPSYCITLMSGGPQSSDMWWIGQSTRHARKENGGGDRRCDSGGGNRR
jgi:hypothetical protein